MVLILTLLLVSSQHLSLSLSWSPAELLAKLILGSPLWSVVPLPLSSRPVPLRWTWHTLKMKICQNSYQLYQSRILSEEIKAVSWSNVIVWSTEIENMIGPTLWELTRPVWRNSIDFRWEGSLFSNCQQDESPISKSPSSKYPNFGSEWSQLTRNNAYYLQSSAKIIYRAVRRSDACSPSTLDDCSSKWAPI